MTIDKPLPPLYKPPRTIEQCNEAARALAAAGEALLNRSTDDVLDDDARTEFAAIENALEDLAVRRELCNLATRPQNIESGDGARASSGPEVMRRVDPWDESRSMADRAAALVERSDYSTDTERESAAELVRRATLEQRAGAPDRLLLRGLHEHVIGTSRPEYVSAFRKYVADPLNFRSLLTTDEQNALVAVNMTELGRSAMSLTAGNGGVMVPQFLDPTITLTNGGTANDVRKFARVEPITAGTWEGVTSAGVSAEWLAEGSEAADASPTFVGPTITAHKAAAWLYGSYEVLADAKFEGVSMLIADGFDRLEETAFATGTGSGQPFGLVTRLSGAGPSLAGSSGAAGAADFVVADIYALDDGLQSRWRRNAKFMAHRTILNKVRRMGETMTNSSAWWADFAEGTPPKLIGHPVGENAGMDSTIVSGSNDDVMLFGDFEQYVVVDRIGTTVLYEPMVKGASQRPTGQAGWFAYKRTGADVITSNGFRLLRL